MNKKAYRTVLEFERSGLFDRICRLKSMIEYSGGLERIRYVQQLRALEWRSDAIDRRLRDLEREGDGLWETIRISLRWIGDGLAGAFERWTEDIDARHATRR